MFFTVTSPGRLRTSTAQFSVAAQLAFCQLLNVRSSCFYVEGPQAELRQLETQSALTIGAEVTPEQSEVSVSAAQAGLGTK